MKLHFTATGDAAEALAALRRRHDDAGPEKADVIVALGGDGFMLQTLHAFLGKGKPIYGMNLGSVGFLMNEYRQENLLERLAAAEKAEIHPLKMQAHTAQGTTEKRAFNEVSLLRETRQAAKIEISVNERIRIAELAGDGVLLATPVGSTAYNYSANGPILPLDSQMLALTPISPFRPRRWRGAILPDRSRVTFRVLEPAKRPVAAVADQKELRDIAEVRLQIDRSREITLLFDPGHALDERIVAEQFAC